MSNTDSKGKKLVEMVKSPNQWYGKRQFNKNEIPKDIFASMNKDPQHLMKIDVSGKTSFLGGYILAYSIEKAMGTREIIEKMPFQYRYVEPFKFAQIMEIHPEDIPETFDTLRSKNKKTVERVQFEGGLVYRIPIRTLAYLSLPIVNQQKFNELSSIDLAYKYRITGDEEYLKKFLDRVKWEVKSMVNWKFKLQKEIFGQELLVAIGLEGAKKAFCKYNFSKNVQIETFMQKFVKGYILDFIRVDDKVPRLIREYETKIEHILEKANAKKEEISLKKLYDIFPETSEETINKAYKLVTKESTEISLQTEIGKGDGFKRTSLQDITEDEASSNRLDPVEILGNAELVEIFLEKLRPYEREMIIRYFIEEQTMKQIGEALDLSESRISQMLPNIIRRVRAKAKKYEY